MSAGLPDGCCAADLPNNSIAAEHRDRMTELLLPEAETQARSELIAECMTRGQVRIGYKEYCAEIHVVSPWQYVQYLERINAIMWLRRVDACLSELMDAQNAMERVVAAARGMV